MPDLDSQLLKTGPNISKADVIVFVVLECVAFPLCHAGGDAFVNSHFGPAIVGFGLGLPTAVMGASFHWWKNWVTESTKVWIQRQILRWSPAALLIAAIHTVGPNVYQRAIGSFEITKS